MAALTGVILVMIPRLTTLALVALLDAVLVHERDDQEFNLLSKPSPLVGIGQDRLQNPFQPITCHGFASVVARRKQDPETALSVEPAKVQKLHLAPLLCLAQHIRSQPGRVTITGEELAQVGLQVGDGHAETCFLGTAREVETKCGIVDCLRPQPAPRPAVIGADRGAPHADDVAASEFEIQGSSRRALNSEAPVKPMISRVPQVLVERHRVALDRFHHDVAAGEGGVYAEGVVGVCGNDPVTAAECVEDENGTGDLHVAKHGRGRRTEQRLSAKLTDLPRSHLFTLSSIA